MNADPSRAKSIFLNAAEIASAAEREAYLAGECQDDAALRREVDELLSHREPAKDFLESPAAAALPTIDERATGLVPRERPGNVIGPYKLLELIGEGGMGAVWMAEQKEPVQRRVALKIIKAGMDTHQVVARFEAERQALALMDHPNIATVLDAGTTVSGYQPSAAGQKEDAGQGSADGQQPTADGRPYFVMELVKGMPITKYCDEHRLTPRQRLELFIPVCQAVQHAHQKGIIHRDLKPSNVLVCHYDGKPVPKIIDFGVAKATGPRLTEATSFTEFGQIVGTLEYMSPEQAELNSLDIDTRCDIYSLGVLLYELLTGTTPIDRMHLKDAAFGEMLRVIREDEPLKPSTRLSHSQDSLARVAALRHTEPAKLTKLVRGELDWIVMKALEKDRSRRYPTATGFAHDIENYLHDEPVQACPPSASYRVKKFLKRNKAPVLGVVTVLLALVAGIIGTSWGLFRAERQRQLAEDNEQKALAAAAAETKAKEAADARLAETRAVLGFVEDKVFAAARPEGVGGGLGREVTLRKTIETALPFVEKSFTDQPLIEARLRCTLAKSFAYLGDAKSALQQLEPAQTLYGKHSAPDDPDALRCMTFLAATYLALGRPVDAVKMHEKTLALQKARLGPEHADTLVSMHHLAESYGRLGRHAESFSLCEEVLAIRKAKLGPDHRDTLRSMHDLANSYNGLGRPTDALKLHEETFALQKAKFGLEDRDTLFSMHEIACCYWALGRHAEARKLQEQRLVIMKAKFGSDHPETIAGMWHLALVLFDQGQHAEALALQQQTLALTKARFGLDHPTTLATSNTLAANYLSAGRQEETRKLLDESLKRVAGKDVGPELMGQLISVRLRYFKKMKDAAGCRVSAKMFEDLKRTDSDSLYEAACMRAVTAGVLRANDKSPTASKEAAAEADRAMAWLMQAVAAGYEDAEHMKRDLDLDGLRDREDFKKLLADLGAGSKQK